MTDVNVSSRDLSLLKGKAKVAGKQPEGDFKRGRYAGVDLLRHVLALAVILHHAASGTRYSSSLNHFIRSFSNYDSAVLGFFMVSGFFSKEPPDLSWRAAWDFLKASSQKLLVPFFIFSVADAIVMALFGKASFSSGLLATISLRGSSMQLYFLPFLFYVLTAFFLFTALSHHLKIQAKISLLFPLVLCLSFSVLYPTPSPAGSDVRLLPLYAVCYLIGFYLSQAFRHRIMLFYQATFALFAASLAAGLTDHRFYSLAVVVFLFAAALGASSLPVLLDKSFPGSGGVYLLHAPVIIYAISALLLKIGINDVFNLILTVVLTYLTCLLIALGFRARFKKLSFLILS